MRVPFHYYLGFLSSTIKEKVYVKRMVARYFPAAIGAYLRTEQQQLKFSEEFDTLILDIAREEFPFDLTLNRDSAEALGILDAFLCSPLIDDAFKLLNGPERESVEMCLLAGLGPDEIVSVLLDKFSLDVDPDVVRVYEHYFFNTKLLLRHELSLYLSLIPEPTQNCYIDCLHGGVQSLCLHLGLEDEDIVFERGLKAAYRLAYAQMMRQKDNPSSRDAVNWSKIMFDSYDRLRAGEDQVRRLIKALSVFAEKEEPHKRGDVNAETGELRGNT